MASTIKHEVTVRYQNAEAKPPVFLAGSFTDPQWDPQEMQCDDEMFFKSFQISAGEWQYKLRLGTGDWWVCDENQPIGITIFGMTSLLRLTAKCVTALAIQTTCSS